MFPFGKHFEFRNSVKVLRLLPLVLLPLFVLLQTNDATAKTHIFTNKILASTNPFAVCPLGTDTIIIRDTFDINVNYEPILFGLPYEGKLIVDGGVLYWSSNVFLKLGVSARILLHKGGHIYPGGLNDTKCNAQKTIYFDVDKLASCSGQNSLHAFSDVNLAGCFDVTGICCDAPILVTDNSGNPNDRTLCQPGDSVTLSVTGSGTLNYNYVWLPSVGVGLGPFTVAQYAANTAYTVSVTAIFDPYGAAPPYLLTCGSAAVVRINPEIKLIATTTPVPCASSAVGAVNLTPTGGTAPYKFLWSNGKTTEDVNSLTAGTYTVSVTDSKGCVGVKSAIVATFDNTPPTLSCPASAAGNAQPNLCTTTIPNINATFSDNCPGAQLTYKITGATTLSGNGQLSNSLPFSTGINNVEYKVSDGSNVVSCNFTVTVTDTQFPTASNPPISTGFQCLTDLPPADPEVVTSEADNCGTPTVTFLSQSVIGGFSCVGNPLIISRKYRVTDGSGNGITVTHFLHIADTTPPMFTSVPASTTVTCQTIPAVGLPSAVDNCTEIINITYQGEVRTNGACPDTYTLTRTWRTSDNCGNATTATQTIFVQDLTPPVFSTVPTNVTVNCSAIPAVGTPTATDECDASVTITYIGETKTNGACQDSYTLRRTWKAADNCGNSATSEQMITVQDVTAPTFTNVPANTTVSCESIPAVGTAIATDNCAASPAVTYLGETKTNGACSGSYILNRSWRATDNCGNTSTATQLITVRDLTSPVFTSVPANVTVSCESVPSVGAPVATDNCDPTVNIVYNGETKTNGACANTYSLKRQWTASDNCGNTKTAMQTITVQDLTKPVFTSVPANTTVSCDALPAVGNPVATDNCDPSATITYTGEIKVNGACPGSYQLRRSWKASDQCGNTATAEQVVTVQDITKPVFTQVPANLTASCDAVPAVGTATATDNCDPSVTISYSGQQRTDGACPNNFTLRREWIATDDCGNTATASQVITIQDVTAPVFTSVPDATMASCENIPAAGTPTATDNCAGIVNITYLGETVPGAGGACPGNFALVRTWKATDACGNTATVSQTITVQDIVAPVITATPANATVSCAAIPAVGTPSATDNCDNDLTITYNGDTRVDGACADSYTLLRKWTVTDDCGNSATTVQTITVEDTTPPQFITVPNATTVNCESIPAVGTPTATDDCAASVSISYNGEFRTDGACPGTYTLERSWTAMDNCGNTAKATQVISVRDITAPAFVFVPASVTASCDAIPAVGTPTATDNCDAAVNISYSGESRVDGACPNSYQLQRVWVATDNCGNSSTASQTITVQDVTKPVFISVPAPVLVECSNIPVIGVPAATDNCTANVSISYLGETRIDDSCPGFYKLVRSWSAKDDCGNTSIASQTISVQDITKPTVLSVPANATVGCDAIPAVGTPTASDNCDPNPGIVYNGATRSNGACPNSYSLQRKWTITDNCGNATTAVQILTVEDNTPPVFISVPSNTLVSCENIPAVATPTASDNCAAAVNITYNGETIINGACLDSYSLRRSWTAKDSCGNTATAVQMITVQDISAPNFTQIPSDVTVNCDGVPAVSTPAAVDNCDAFVSIVYSGQIRVDGNCNHSYMLRREWVATDNCGNNATATQRITVQDKTAPVFTTVPSAITVSCDNIPSVGAPTATDNCDPAVVISYLNEIRTNGNCPGNYTLKRTWTATDDCNNAAPATQIITVQDIAKPVFTFVPKDSTVNCNAIPLVGTPTATDNCTATPTITFDGETVMNSTSMDSYSLQRKWTAVDNCGNMTTAIQMLIVQDTVKPSIQCPANIVKKANAADCAAIIMFNAPGTSDNCSSSLTISTTANSGQSFPIGVTNVTMTATDNSGNMAVCSFKVTVQDTTKPVLVNCPPNLTFTTPTNSCETVVNWAAPNVTDPCDLYTIVPTVDIERGTMLPTGIYPNTYTAKDTTGNSSNCKFIITVREDEAPVLSNCPQDTVLYTNTCEAVANWMPPTATDNCELGNVVVTIPSGSIFPETVTAVEYTASDLWGNTATCAFTVTVVDIVPPVFSGCPNNMTVNSGGACSTPVTWGQPSATDNCSPNPIVYSLPTPGSVFPVGFTTVNVFVKDPSGNLDTCTFVVEVIGPDIGLANLPVSQSFIGCEAIVNWNAPVPTGICGPITLTNTHAPGDTFGIGVTEVLYTLSDTLGHTVITSFTVTVTESIAPQFSCPASPIKVNISGAVLSDPSSFITATDTINTCMGVELEFLYPIATDNCSVPLVTQASGMATANVFNIGTHNLSFMAKDDAGNTTLCSVQIEVLPLYPLNPQVSDKIGCKDDEITLSATVVPGAIYSWTGPLATYPDNNNIMIPALDSTLTGIYTVYATVNGCLTPLDSALVRIGRLPKAFDDVNYEVATNETLSNFNVLLNDIYESDDYTLTFLAPLPPGLIDHGDGLLSFEAGNRNGTFSFFYSLCSKACPNLCDIGTVTISVRERICSFIPNIITPNGDGLNDFLAIPCLDIEPYPNNHLIVYNQWGAKVFEANPYSNNPDQAWRGTMDGDPGKPLPDATYFFVFKATPDDGGLKGFIEVYR